MTHQLEHAKVLLAEKVPAPLVEGTAAYQTIVAIELLIEELNNSLGESRKRSRDGDNNYDFREQAYRKSYTEPKDTPFRH